VGAVGGNVGENHLPIDEHASTEPSTAAAEALAPTSPNSWRNGLRLEAVANLAHELRTPVQVLLGYVDILRDDYGDQF
jgi:signal transduction histidine kinase